MAQLLSFPCQKWTHGSFIWLLEKVQCTPQKSHISLSFYTCTALECTHSFSLLPFSFSVCLCPVHLRFLRSWDSKGDFILHWAMKALYKYIATASALIASAILIWVFCCASQQMEKKERVGGIKGGRESTPC